MTTLWPNMIYLSLFIISWSYFLYTTLWVKMIYINLFIVTWSYFLYIFKYFLLLVLSNHQGSALMMAFCRGLAPRVPRVIGYDPQIYIRPISSSGKLLGNYTPRTVYDPSTLGWRGGPTYLKRIRFRTDSLLHLITISVDQQDFTTCRPNMNHFHNPAGSVPEAPTATPEGF
jgi:hypothetical protein